MTELPFNSVDFAEMWQDFMDMKEEVHKFKYKSDRSLKMAFKKLVRYSHNNEEIAIAILENAISEEWKGFHPLKHDDPLMVKLKSIKVNQPRKLSASEILRQKHGISST